jgi:putative membrane protein
MAVANLAEMEQQRESVHPVGRRKAMKTLATRVAAGVVILALALMVRADENKLIEKKPAEKEPTTDQEFLVWALACEMSEVKFADMALKSASNDSVKKLAQKVHDGHMKVRDDLLNEAKEMKVAVVEGLEKHHREMYAKLGKLEGGSFDREYLRYLVEGHEIGVKMYQKWAKEARNSTLRDIASRALLNTKDHLEQAQQLQARLK